MSFDARTTTTLLSAAVLVGCLEGGSDTVASADPPASNSPPSISGGPPPSVQANQDYDFTPTAQDPDGDSLVFSVVNLPPWATFNTASGNISGTPDMGDVGSYSSIRISVSDGELTAELDAFDIDVVAVATGQVSLGWVAPEQDESGSSVTNLTGFNIYYGTQSGAYPNVVEVDTVGMTSIVIDQLSPATYYFVATAVNGDGEESEFSNEVTVVVN